MNIIKMFAVSILVAACVFGLYRKYFKNKVEQRRKELQQIIKVLNSAIAALNDGISANTQTYAEISKVFTTNEVFKTTWKQYEKNIIMVSIDENRKRATVEAESYFTVSVLLCGLKNDFWKNLGSVK